MDLVSVIVPVYNVEKYLSDCIESITNQTYRQLEIILVDDGSTDASGDICDEYGKKDERIQVIHKENGGLSDARNTGLDRCTGEYIAFVDSDDIVSVRFIEYLHKTISMDSYDIVSLIKSARFWDDGVQKPLFDETESYKTEVLNPTQALRKMYYQTIPTGIPHRLYKRKIFDSIRFPVGYLYEDLATSYKLFMNAKRIAAISSVLYGYRLRVQGIIRGDFKKTKLIVLPIGHDLFNDSCLFDPGLEHSAACRAFSAISSVFLQAPLSDNESIDQLWNGMKRYRRIVVRNDSKEMRKKIYYCAKMMIFGKTITHIFGRRFGQKGSFN